MQGDMTSLALGQEFDVVLCLDGAIGYVQPDDLPRALRALADHVVPGGLLLLEPWYSPQSWKPGKIHTVQQVDESSGITVVRMAYGSPDGAIEFHNLVGDDGGISHFIERYRFWLHEVGDMFDALRAAGMSSVSLDDGQSAFKRGLIIAQR